MEWNAGGERERERERESPDVHLSRDGMERGGREREREQRTNESDAPKLN
jgi:hypothetical protein